MSLLKKKWFPNQGEKRLKFRDLNKQREATEIVKSKFENVQYFPGKGLLLPDYAKAGGLFYILTKHLVTARNVQFPNDNENGRGINDVIHANLTFFPDSVRPVLDVSTGFGYVKSQLSKNIFK